MGPTLPWGGGGYAISEEPLPTAGLPAPIYPHIGEFLIHYSRTHTWASRRLVSHFPKLSLPGYIRSLFSLSQFLFKKGTIKPLSMVVSGRMYVTDPRM